MKDTSYILKLDLQRQHYEQELFKLLPDHPQQALVVQEKIEEVENQMSQVQATLNHLKQQSINHKIAIGKI
jgi:hypothetical protein